MLRSVCNRQERQDSKAGKERRKGKQKITNREVTKNSKSGTTTLEGRQGKTQMHARKVIS